MGAGMWVDRAGAVEIAEAAKEFEWTWTPSNVERFVAQVDRPQARISGTDGRVDYLVVTVAASSEAEEELGPALGAAFHQVMMGLWTGWDPPTERTVLAEFGASWVFPNVGVGVAMGERSIELWLIAPAARERWIEQSWQAVSELTSSAEWDVFAAAMSVLARTDPGDWTRAEMDKVVHAIGWETDPEVEAKYGALRSRSGSASLWVGPSDADDRRYGFGEFRIADLSLRIAEGTTRIAYLTALDLCVRELGAPSLVGGPYAFATWRRGPLTLTLSRREPWLSTGSVELAVRPTEAVENEDYTYAKWDELWEPSYWWRVRPDREADRSDIVGMYTPGAPRVRDWAEFDERLGQLFGSLGADVPVLFRFLTTVIWVITTDVDTGFIAQGWFSADECRVETHEGEDIVFRHFPPGRAGAEQVIAIVRAAVRSAVDAPERLMYYAFATAPQQLWDFRLGLARDTREDT